MIIDNESRESFSSLFKVIYKDNEMAESLSFLILEIVHVWDDLIDKDKPIEDGDINKAFLAAVVELSINPLWGEDLAYNFLNVYLRWQDANHIESDASSSDNDISMAWMLRAGVYDLFSLIALKLHGIEWAVTIGPTVRKLYGEKLIDFKKEFGYA